MEKLVCSFLSMGHLYIYKRNYRNFPIGTKVSFLETGLHWNVKSFVILLIVNSLVMNRQNEILLTTLEETSVLGGPYLTPSRSWETVRSKLREEALYPVHFGDPGSCAVMSIKCWRWFSIFKWLVSVNFIISFNHTLIYEPWEFSVLLK